MIVDRSGKRCSIKNMRAKRQSSLVTAGEAGALVSPLPSTSEKPAKPKWPPQKRQSSGSSDDNAHTNRPPKLFFARRSSKDSSSAGKDDPQSPPPPLSPPPLSPGVKVMKLCLYPPARRAYEEALALQQQQQLQNSQTTSTSTLVEPATPTTATQSQSQSQSQSQKRQSSLDTLVDEPGSVAEAERASSTVHLKQRMQLTDQQLMLIVVVLAVSQGILLARLRAAAM